MVRFASTERGIERAPRRRALLAGYQQCMLADNAQVIYFLRCRATMVSDQTVVADGGLSLG